ncbi:MAG: formyltransferase family protein [Patescibacteria group bacterium]
MKLYFIIVDEPFFHPQFLAQIFEKEKDNIVGLTILPDKPVRRSFFNYLKGQYQFWGARGFVKLSFRVVAYKILDFFQRLVHWNKFYSVEAVAKQFALPIYRVKKVNDPAHLDYLKSKNIDLIISACGQIFKKELLGIPRQGVINRHSSLLPKYGGLWPVFWALLNGDKELGVSVHFMAEKIDSGDIIWQEKFCVQDDDTLETAYKKAFQLSPQAIIRAVEKIGDNDLSDIIKFDQSKSSYFSNPKTEDIKKFKSKRKMI